MVLNDEKRNTVEKYREIDPVYYHKKVRNPKKTRENAAAIYMIKRCAITNVNS